MCHYVGISLEEAKIPSGAEEGVYSPKQRNATTMPRYDPVAEIIHTSTELSAQTINAASYLTHFQDPEPSSSWETETILYGSFSGSVPRDLYTIYQNNDLDPLSLTGRSWKGSFYCTNRMFYH